MLGDLRWGPSPNIAASCLLATACVPCWIFDPQRPSDLFSPSTTGPPIPHLLSTLARPTHHSTSLHGNPHSEAGWAPESRSAAADAARLATLRWCNADPEHYCCIFTAGATGARLLGQLLATFRLPGSLVRFPMRLDREAAELADARARRGVRPHAKEARRPSWPGPLQPR